MFGERLQIRERFDPALIPALYHNFKDPLQAILELTDNAVDDLIKGKAMVVTVNAERDHLMIVNKGGTGMGPSELEAFFVWGKSTKRGKLGRYGQGGKAAMGYLGKSWEIRSTKMRDDNDYLIKEDNWDDRTDGLKRYYPSLEKSHFSRRGRSAD